MSRKRGEELETKAVMIYAVVLGVREIKGTVMYKVQIPSKPYPIWVEESDLAE